MADHRWDYPDGHPAWVGWGSQTPPHQTRVCVDCQHAQYRFAGEVTWRDYDRDGNMTPAKETP
ncbi:MAG: hypothetical protein GEU78_09510 [Actinobacteria bacterium]|nr:hypothetical protein [Actinomycetota bacterium]